MDIFSIIITVIGLTVFEVVSSIDNAVINAEVLSTMKPKARNWFLLWGLLFAVVVVRGLLPWLIVWAATPSLGPIGSITATFSGDPKVASAFEQSAPFLLAAGGVFLLFLFLHWLFLEEKNFGLPTEKYFIKHGAWFYGTAGILLTIIVKYALDINTSLALGAVIGSTTFFILHGFKETAEKEEKQLASGKTGEKSDRSKLLYLEVIDTVFSIDGVLGAFAFTFSVPLILLGNGLGAIVVRQLTIGNIENIKKYAYLKNGAMYSIVMLGAVMVGHSFGLHIPEYVSPVATILIVGGFFYKSHRAIKV